MVETTKSPEDMRNELLAKSRWHRAEADRLDQVAKRLDAAISEAADALERSEKTGPTPEKPATKPKKPTVKPRRPKVLPSSGEADKAAVGRPRKIQAVYDAIRSYAVDLIEPGETFTRADVFKWFRSDKPDLGDYDIGSEAFADAFRATLRQCIKDGFVKIETPPQGRRQGVYRGVNPDPK